MRCYFTSGVVIVISLAAFLAVAPLRAENWPQYRGPTGQGQSTESGNDLMDKLESIRAFTKVVQHGSFSAAARELRLSRSAVSKYVIDLEQMSERLKRVPNYESVLNHLASSHSSPEQVGANAKRAGVKTLVLSHLTPAIDSISDDTWRAPAAKFFKGEIVVAKDLMVV